MSETTTPAAAPVADKGNLLEVTGLSKRFPLKHTVFDAMLRKERQYLTAVDNVSLTLAQGETLGLVGESGCGKSTLARTIINLYRPTEGKVVFEGTDFAALSKKELRARRTDIQMIFQDPYSSLNPRMTVRQVLREVLLHHNICGKDEVDAQIQRLLDLVGLSEEQASRLPSASRTSSPSASVSASASPAPWRPARVSSSPTSRSRPWTCRSRRRSSTCSSTSRSASTWRCCSLATTCASCATSRTAWP